MLFSQADQDRLIPLWQEHAGQKLGAKAAKQFETATRDPSHWFAKEILRPNLFRPGIFSDVYFPVDLTKFSVGRNHHYAQLLAEDPEPLLTYGGDPLTGLTLFSNPLRSWVPIRSCDEQQPEVPMDRVVLGEHHVLTYEFDVADPEFLKLQLSWLRSPKNPLDCPMGKLYRHLSLIHI